MRHSPSRSFIAMIGLLATLVSLGGCLVAQSKKSEVAGNYVSPETLASIKPGMPLSDAIAFMGEPSSRGTLSDGAEVCRWSYTRTDKGAGYVFLIFAGSDDKQRSMTTFVQARGGVIERVWQDEEKH